MKPLFATLVLLCTVGAVVVATGHAADIDNSQDHPVVSRYPGSEIVWHDVQAFAPYYIATGPVTGYQRIDDWEETQGRLTRIYYELAGQKTHTEVFENYKKALAAADFDFTAEGLFPHSNRSAEIGSRRWLPVHYGRNEIPPVGIRLLQGSSTSGGSAFLAATKARAAGIVHVVIATTQYSEDVVTTMIDVIEVDTVETDLVTINAEAMGSDIDEYGRVTLDGLFFDHDKATLTPASKSALDEIARFLKQRGSMNFYVVGHTDAVGSFDYNTGLSKRRAQSVATTLQQDYGIEAARLTAHGVGPLVPVFSNSSEGGRAKNRRVDLVERP